MLKHNLVAMPTSISKPMLENLARRVRCELVELAPNTFEFVLHPRVQGPMPPADVVTNYPELNASRHGKNCTCAVCQFIKSKEQ